MPTDPGFDFIRLTRSQWKHLLRIQRDHGILWHQYIKILIQQDMDNSSKPKTPMADKEPITPEKVDRLINKIEELLSRPMTAMPTWMPKGNSKFEDILRGEVVTEPSFKPSKMSKAKVNPNVLSDGTSVQSPEFRKAFLHELKEALGIPLEDNNKNKPEIKFSNHVRLNPPPPPSE